MAEGKGRTFIVGSIDQMLLLPSWSTEMPRRPEVGPLSSAMRKGESRDTCARARLRRNRARGGARRRAIELTADGAPRRAGATQRGAGANAKA